MPINLSETAAREIKTIITQQGLPEADTKLRVGVKGGGCSGFSYSLGFDTEVSERDRIAEFHGVRMAVVPDATLEHPRGTPFRLLGGHRLWVAPEVPSITYEPDDRPCAVAAIGGGVRVEATPDGAWLVKALEVRAAGDRWIVDHELRNASGRPVSVAPWAITQLRPGGTAMLPLGDRAVASYPQDWVAGARTPFLGIGGLLGSGRSELLLSIFGAEPVADDTGLCGQGVEIGIDVAQQVRRVQAVKEQVHHSQEVGHRLLFDAEEGFLLEAAADAHRPQVVRRGDGRADA